MRRELDCAIDYKNEAGRLAQHPGDDRLTMGL